MDIWVILRFASCEECCCEHSCITCITSFCVDMNMLSVLLGIYLGVEFLGPIVACASKVVLVVKNLPANAGDGRDAGLISGLGRSPGGGNTTHSSILACGIPWTEDPGRLQSTGSQRVGHNWRDLACTHTIVIHWQGSDRSLHAIDCGLCAVQQLIVVPV